VRPVSFPPLFLLSFFFCSLLPPSLSVLFPLLVPLFFPGAFVGWVVQPPVVDFPRRLASAFVVALHSILVIPDARACLRKRNSDLNSWQRVLIGRYFLLLRSRFCCLPFFSRGGKIALFVILIFPQFNLSFYLPFEFILRQGPQPRACWRAAYFPFSTSPRCALYIHSVLYGNVRALASSMVRQCVWHNQ